MKRIVELILIILFLALFLHSGISQSRIDFPFSHEPDKCYEKVLMPNEYEITEEQIALYVGDKINAVELDTIMIQLSEEQKIWVKRNVRLTSNKVWCLIEVPAEYEEYVIVKDTAKTSQYIIETIEIERLVKEGGFMEWMEVICYDKVTDRIIKQIETRLKDLGYYNCEIKGLFNSEVRESLTEFQRANYLGMGHITAETLYALGIFW